MCLDNISKVEGSNAYGSGSLTAFLVVCPFGDSVYLSSMSFSLLVEVNFQSRG